MQQELNFLEIIQRGALTTYPLIILSIVSVAVILERLWTLRNAGAATQTLANSILDSVKHGRKDLAMALCRQNNQSAASRVFLAILALSGGESLEKSAAFMNEAMFEETQKMKKNLWVLGTVASSAPFIGLLGTVIGIIKSFENMAIVGTGGFTVVAAGISEALVATALGLGIAIIALIFYNYFQVRIGNISGLVRIQAMKLLQSVVS
ncbi:MAG TPA: MotA/TolQ/ExbB proton channel family protein [Candidatus Binatia bacterium]|jgi:biopolymer transport protein ExbB